MNWDQIVTVGTVVGAFAIIGTVIGAIFKLGKAIWNLNRRFGHFLDDWNGEPSRDGQPGRPGALARISAVEKELKPNGGSTLKDAVNRVEASIGEMQGHMLTNTGRLERCTDMLEALDERVADLEDDPPPRSVRRRRR